MALSANSQIRKSILGVILAGGQSTRFGSDKAAAIFQGKTLMEHAISALSAQCDRIVISGRPEKMAMSIPDWPEPGLGPLGGLAGALIYARDQGFEFILTCGVDSVGLPDDLAAMLGPAPAFLKEQPVIGLWPVSILPQLRDFLASEEKNALWRFGRAVGARAIMMEELPANINRPADLENLRDPEQK